MREILEKLHFSAGMYALPDALDGELRRVVEAWPVLPPAIRTAIQALVQVTCRTDGG